MAGVLTTISQHDRLVEAVTPPGTDGMVPVRVVGTEELSSPFLYTIDFISPDPAVGPEKMLGKPVALTIAPTGMSKRNVHGIVRRWTDLGLVGTAGLTQYQAELVPSFWLLTLSSDCRTFENKPVTEIISTVLKDAGVSDFRFRPALSLPPIPYVAQYQESDFAFVSRLLEDAGLYYTFEHTSSAHTLIVSNSFGRSIPDGDLATIPVAPAIMAAGAKTPGTSIGNTLGEGAGQKVTDAVSQIAGAKLGGVIGAGLGTIIGPLGTLAGGALGSLLGGLVEDLLGNGGALPTADTIQTLQRQRAVHTHTFAARDFHLLRPADSDTASSKRPGAAGTRFEFLGDLSGTDAHGVTTATTTRRIETEETQGDLVRGTSTVASLTAGSRVTITGGVLGSSGLDVHVTHVAHVAEISGVIAGGDLKSVYLNEFVAIPAATQYLPPRVTARPSVRGTQTALVVGSGAVGDVDVDKDGRVLLQFPWDRGAGADKKSQHRVHVATAWAGVGWGSVFLPRIGQEVLVEFLEGDPDRPIVTGRVYSNNHAHPYALPDNKTRSGTKSRTIGGGADNFNELRFDDKQGKEHVFLQAERNLRVKVKKDEKRTVGHDRSATIQHNDTHEITEGDQILRVLKGNQTLFAAEGTQIIEDKLGDQALYAVEGKQLMRADKGPQDFLVKDGDRSVKVEQGDNTATISGTDSTDADTIKLTAKSKIELKVGASTITMEPAQIVIKSGASKITLAAAGVKVEGATFEAKGMGTAKVTAAMVTVEGTGIVKVAGPMVQAAADGMLKLAGGITMVG